MITWVCCVLVVALSRPCTLRGMEFMDAMALSLLLFIMLLAGPLGLALTLFASLIKLLSNV